MPTIIDITDVRKIALPNTDGQWNNITAQYIRIVENIVCWQRRIILFINVMNGRQADRPRIKPYVSWDFDRFEPMLSRKFWRRKPVYLLRLKVCSSCKGWLLGDFFLLWFSLRRGGRGNRIVVQILRPNVTLKHRTIWGHAENVIDRSLSNGYTVDHGCISKGGGMDGKDSEAELS